MTTATYETAFEQIKSFLYQKGSNGLKQADTDNDDYIVKQEFAQFVINNITEWNGLESTKEDIINQFYNNFNNNLINPNGGGNIPNPNPSPNYTCTWPDLQHTAMYNSNTTPETYTPTITRTNTSLNTSPKLKPTVDLSLAGGNKCSLVNFNNGSFTINPNDIKAGTYNFTIVMKIDGQQIGMKTYSVVVTKKQTENTTSTVKNDAADETEYGNKVVDTDETEYGNKVVDTDETEYVNNVDDIEETIVKHAYEINPSNVDWHPANATEHLEAYGIDSSNGNQVTAVDFGTLYSNNAVINLHQATHTDTDSHREADATIVSTRINQLGEYIVNAIMHSTSGYSYNLLTQAAQNVVSTYINNLSIPADGDGGSFLYRGRRVDQRSELTNTIQGNDSYQHGIYTALDTAESGWTNGYNYMVSFRGLVNDILAEYDRLLG